MESCSTQAVLPWVGLAADKVIRDRHIGGGNAVWLPAATDASSLYSLFVPAE
ncbi:MAG: hypothetical protein ACQESR_26010 [Planctomycetota bacterium]